MINFANDIHALRRVPALEMLFTKWIGICAATVVLGLLGIPEARATETINGFYTPGGTVGVGSFKVVSVTCPHFPANGDYSGLLFWILCNSAAGEMAFTGDPVQGPPPPKQSKDSSAKADLARPGASILGQHPAIQKGFPAGQTPSLALSSSTPGLPFLGNPLVVVSYVRNSAAFANATAAYQVGLRRQSDCSLAEDLIWPDAASPNTPHASFITSIPAAQDYFHKLSGLATAPDVFAKGCNYALLGQPSNANVLLLGATADGAVISAEVPGSLLISVTDATANTFTTTTLLNSTTNPSLGAMSTADLNGDGILDLVATFAIDPANRALSTAVFLGNGDGTFKPGVYYDIAGDITIDDVNGDGKPDIVICGSTPGITTLIGKGDGTFTASAVSATGIGPCFQAAGQVLTGTFTGSGKKDLLLHGQVLLGHGDGTFTAGSPIPTNGSLVQEFGNTAVGDVNNDGKLDVVIDQPGYVIVFYGNGDGTFTAGPRYAALKDLEQVSLTDIDGDGNLDIVIGTSTGGIFTDGGLDTAPPLFQILMGRGDGTFVDSVAYNQGHYGNGEYSVAGPQIATADFNHDGKADVLVFTASNSGGQPGTLDMLPGNNTAALSSAITSFVNLTPTMLISADMNTDGKPDAVLAGTTLTGPHLAVLINQGNGTFAGEQDYALPNSAVSLAAGDFNGDGRMDVAVGVTAGPGGGGGSSGIYVLFGQTNGTLGAPVKIDSSVNPTGLAAGDINGDGRSDLIVADQGFFAYVGAPSQVNGVLHVYLGNANGTFTTAASPTTSATNYSVAALGDLNGDGKLDLVVGGNIAGAQDTSTPSVYTLLGNGDGTFNAPFATALVGNYGIGTTSIALADFNHDGHLDVAAADATAFTSVLLGNGDGTFTNALLALGQQPLALAAADLNGDGFPELLVGTNDTFGNADLTVFLNANAWPALATEPTYSAGRLTLPLVSIGNANYSDMVITVGGIVSGPTGTSPESSGDAYNPATKQMTIPEALVNATTFHNVVITVGSLVSIGSVEGADAYDGAYLSISSVQVGGTIFDKVVVTLGKLVNVAGGMPQAVRDQYNPANRQLLIPAVEFGGHVYTNVTITVGSVISVGGRG